MVIGLCLSIFFVNKVVKIDYDSPIVIFLEKKLAHHVKTKHIDV
jgi:hypothetical protein